MGTDLSRESDSKYEMYLAQARLKQEVAQGLTELMHREGVSATELARRLGKSKGHISKLLSGDSNLTLDTVAEVYCAFDRQVHLVLNQVSDLQAPIDELDVPYVEYQNGQCFRVHRQPGNLKLLLQKDCISAPTSFGGVG